LVVVYLEEWQVTTLSFMVWILGKSSYVIILGNVIRVAEYSIWS